MFLGVRPNVDPEIFRIAIQNGIFEASKSARLRNGCDRHGSMSLSAAMDLQSPSVLAQLPRPLHASTGKTHIGEVYSLADSKKRKRYEVVVAVDGEAVNIYNVRTLRSFMG